MGYWDGDNPFAGMTEEDIAALSGQPPVPVESGIVQDPLTGQMINTNDPFAGTALPTDAAHLPMFNAASIDLNALPKLPHGFDPEMMALAQTRSDEGIAQGGMQQMSQLRRTLGQAGLSSSPAAAGYQAALAGHIGDQQNAGRRDLQISNLQEANRMALESAQMLFGAMRDNAGFKQQAEGAMYGTRENALFKNADNAQRDKEQGKNLLFGTQPFNPGVGPKQDSEIGAGLEGWGKGFGSN